MAYFGTVVCVVVGSVIVNLIVLNVYEDKQEKRIIAKCKKYIKKERSRKCEKSK